MKNKIFNTNNDLTGFIIRLTLGIILFPHGAQKLLGMFGGYGFSGTIGFFTGTMHLPCIPSTKYILSKINTGDSFADKNYHAKESGSKDADVCSYCRVAKHWTNTKGILH